MKIRYFLTLPFFLIIVILIVFKVSKDYRDYKDKSRKSVNCEIPILIVEEISNDPFFCDSTEVVCTGDVYDVTTYSARIVAKSYRILELAEESVIGVQISSNIADLQEHSNVEVFVANDIVGNEFSLEIKGLERNSTYYYCAFVYSDGVYYYGMIRDFKTETGCRFDVCLNDSGCGEMNKVYKYYALGSKVKLTATPKKGCYFVGWSDCESKELTRWVDVNSDTTITATFYKKPYLHVESNLSSYGKVTNCSGYYEVGDEVEFEATPLDKLFRFVGWSDGNKDNPRMVKVNTDISYIAIFEIPIVASGAENGYSYVDLGLSVDWAICNVGAYSPEKYGDYFAWGETSVKDVYSLNTYKWCKKSISSMTKYCKNPSYGIVDNKDVLDLEDDAARVNMGGKWRMPTKEEQDELRNKCTFKWVENFNGTGVAGDVVIGPNGNVIFLPAAGYKVESALRQEGKHGLYWLGSLYSYFSDGADGLFFDYGSLYWDSNYRCYGQPVRGVVP